MVKAKLQVGTFRFNVLPLYRIHHPVQVVHALLSYFLPLDLQPALASPSADSRIALLSNILSGQLLCFGYNACVSKSKKPWGFVSQHDIHDIIALEHAAKQTEDVKARRLWTFRWTDNLRLWAGCIKSSSRLSS